MARNPCGLFIDNHIRRLVPRVRQSVVICDIHEIFVGPDITTEADAVERFCAVVGNQGKSFKVARNGVVKAPMDFAIVMGWKVGC